MESPPLCFFAWPRRQPGDIFRPVRVFRLRDSRGLLQDSAPQFRQRPRWRALDCLQQGTLSVLIAGPDVERFLRPDSRMHITPQLRLCPELSFIYAPVTLY